MNIGLHRIVHHEYSIPANSSACQHGREFPTDRYDNIAKPQGPSIELMVEPNLEIFSGITMVKRYPTKISSRQEGNKEMRFGSVRFDNVRSMTIKYLAQHAQNGKIKRAGLSNYLDRYVQTAGCCNQLIV
jgi:hypothetical protein